MHHLALGLDPRELGTAPFALVTTSALTRPAAELGLEVHPGSPGLHPALHRGSCRGRRRRCCALRRPTPPGPAPAAGRCRHQRRAGAGEQGPLAGGIEPHRPGLRGSPDLVGPTGGTGRHRAGAHRPATLEPRFSVIGQEHMVRRAGLRLLSRDRDLRVGDHRGHRRAVPGRGHRLGRGASATRLANPIVARGSVPRRDRTFSYVLCFEPDRGHAERCPRGATGQGRALRRGPASHGPLRR